MTLPPQINDRIKESFISAGGRDSIQQVISCSDSGNTLEIDSNGAAQVNILSGGLVDDNNTTSVALLADQEFTGTATECLNYSIIYVNVYSDVGSATDGLHIEFSSDGVNWREGLGDEFTIEGGFEKTFSFQANKKYFRVHYINGGIDQSVFDLQTILKKNYGKPSSHRIQDSIIDEDDAELVKSVITGKTTQGDFINASLTNGGNFKISLEELESGVSVNSNTQLKTTSYTSSGGELFTSSYPGRVDFPSDYFDIFGKFQVASPFKLYEYSATLPLDTVRYHSILTSGSGTVTRNATKTQIELYTSTLSGDRAVFQTRRNIQYNKANAQQVFFIYRPNPLSNRRERFGPHDDNNGTFFEIEGTNVSIKIRSNTSGSVVDTQITQSNWDDPLDGNGPSGLTIDWTKQAVFKVEFGWLSSRGIKFFIDVQGAIVLVHSYLISNTLTVPYWATPNLPMRFDVENIGVTSQAQINSFSCFAYLSSGASEQEGPIRILSNDVTASAATTTETIVGGIRLNSSFLNGSILPLSLSVLSSSGADFLRYRLRYNPTLTGASWASGSGIHDTLTSVTSFTGGSVILSGIIALANNGVTNVSSINLSQDVYLGRDLSGSADALVLTFQMDKSTGSAFYDLNFKEFI